MTICEVWTSWEQRINGAESQKWRGMRMVCNWETSVKT